MPKIFKTLATISIWALFVSGLGGMVFSAIDTLTRSGGITGEAYNFSDAVWWLVSVVNVFLAVMAMKVRKELE